MIASINKKKEEININIKENDLFAKTNKMIFCKASYIYICFTKSQFYL